MKIAIPIAGGTLCQHFGHCEQFALLDVDEAGGRVGAMSLHIPPPHEPGVLPKWLAELGVSLVIAGGMGQRAQAIFSEHGVKVLVGAQGGTPQEIAKAYLGGKLTTGPNACDH
ncbi:MAG: NifB/NifX family molybdenum-iron cluster-binding protein [Desulfocurvibacter africanus]